MVAGAAAATEARAHPGPETAPDGPASTRSARLATGVVLTFAGALQAALSPAILGASVDTCFGLGGGDSLGDGSEDLGGGSRDGDCQTPYIVGALAVFVTGLAAHLVGVSLWVGAVRRSRAAERGRALTWEPFIGPFRDGVVGGLRLGGL